MPARLRPPRSRRPASETCRWCCSSMWLAVSRFSLRRAPNLIRVLALSDRVVLLELIVARTSEVRRGGAAAGERARHRDRRPRKARSVRIVAGIVQLKAHLADGLRSDHHRLGALQRRVFAHVRRHLRRQAETADPAHTGTLVVRTYRNMAERIVLIDRGIVQARIEQPVSPRRCVGGNRTAPRQKRGGVAEWSHRVSELLLKCPSPNPQTTKISSRVVRWRSRIPDYCCMAASRPPRKGLRVSRILVAIQQTEANDVNTGIAYPGRVMDENAAKMPGRSNSAAMPDWI